MHLLFYIALYSFELRTNEEIRDWIIRGANRALFCKLKARPSSHFLTHKGKQRWGWDGTEGGKEGKEIAK